MGQQYVTPWDVSQVFGFEEYSEAQVLVVVDPELDPELAPDPELDPTYSHLPLDISYPEEDPLYPQVRHVPVVEHDRHVNLILLLLPTNKSLQPEQEVAVSP